MNAQSTVSLAAPPPLPTTLPSKAARAAPASLRSAYLTNRHGGRHRDSGAVESSTRPCSAHASRTACSGVSAARPVMRRTKPPALRVEDEEDGRGWSSSAFWRAPGCEMTTRRRRGGLHDRDLERERDRHGRVLRGSARRAAMRAPRDGIALPALLAGAEKMMGARPLPGAATAAASAGGEDIRCVWGGDADLAGCQTYGKLRSMRRGAGTVLVNSSQNCIFFLSHGPSSASLRPGSAFHTRAGTHISSSRLVLLGVSLHAQQDEADGQALFCVLENDVRVSGFCFCVPPLSPGAGLLSFQPQALRAPSSDSPPA